MDSHGIPHGIPHGIQRYSSLDTEIFLTVTYTVPASRTSCRCIELKGVVV